MALGFVPALSTPSRAQDAAQEPPGRVGRLVLIDGTVSYHTADQNYWQRARRNYPVTTGQSFRTEPNSHAAIDIATNRIYLDGSTELTSPRSTMRRRNSPCPKARCSSCWTRSRRAHRSRCRWHARR